MRMIGQILLTAGIAWASVYLIDKALIAGGLSKFAIGAGGN